MHETLPDLSTVRGLLERAAQSPAGVTFLDGRGRPGEARPYAELRDEALAVASRLRAAGVGERVPVFVCLPTSWDFLVQWFGTLLAGAWPVAIAPPGGLGSAEYLLRRVAEIGAHLGAVRIVALESTIAAARRFGIDWIIERAWTPGAVAELPAARDFHPTEAEPDDVAFLQLTSGSTGRSRAVMIPHRAVVHNARGINHAIGVPWGTELRVAKSTASLWLPMHHDMGLIGVLTMLSCRIDLVLSTPRTFLGRPHTWLASLGQRGHSFSAAPNFAYEACLERVPAAKLAGVDLSRFEGALVGAEMVRPDTMAAFAERYAELGFEARFLRPCYGLAEGTLAVTLDQRGEGPRSSRAPEEAGRTAPAEIVTCGAPIPDTEVAIVAPDGTPLADDRIGEVRAKGPSIFAGYYNDPEATAESLVDGWLVTGDLGFVRDGELWITGRTKDLIIANGHNLMPHELEWLAEAATGGGGACRAGAFAVDRGHGDEATVVVEVDTHRALSELDHEIRSAVGQAVGIPLADVVFVRRGRLPKTTSGKVQRRELRRRYQEGELERLPLEA